MISCVPLLNEFLVSFGAEGGVKEEEASLREVMALRPPYDFAPPLSSTREPSERELRELWDRCEARARDRERRAEW